MTESGRAAPCAAAATAAAVATGVHLLRIDRLTVGRVGALVLAVVGVVVLADRDPGGAAPSDWRGDLLCLTGGCSGRAPP
jgi:drug/metabolite transporter (DMT)-like permease